MKTEVKNLSLLLQIYSYEIIFGLSALILAYVITMAMKKVRNNFPPRLIGLPIVGYLPFITKNPHLYFTKLAQKYGDVFSVKLGTKEFVLVNGADAILEVLKKPEFLGKIPDTVFKRKNAPSVFFGSDFQLWKEQHTCVVYLMKDLGLGKTKIEGDILDEINHFMDVLRESVTRPVNIEEPLFFSISSNICSLIFGRQFKHEYTKRRLVNKNVKNIMKASNHFTLEMLLPWLRYVPFTRKLLQSQESKTAYISSVSLFKEEIKKHSKSFNPDDIRDFIDQYLVEIDKRRAECPDTSFNHTTLVNNIMDLFIAGTETITTAFLWILYNIAAFPDVQKKIQKEIFEVIGPDNTPKCMDMKKMPYTNAAIFESMRWKTTLPFNAKRCTLADTKLGRYSLQKGTVVLINFWAIHHGSRLWEEPDKFKPERFLSRDGKSVVKPKYFLPFSDGRRTCPGEPMAYMELFLYLTSILREFDVAFPAGTEPNFSATLYLTYQADPYLVRFIPKKESSNNEIVN